MKRPVIISPFCLILTILTIILLIGILVYTIRFSNSLAGIITLSVLLLIVLISTLIFSPVSISADDDSVSVNRPLKTKRIPYSEIESVMLCPPTMSERRLCGSGGFFGYWGWFREPSIGKYFAYYGKASDCFLVKLKDGNQYLLGCRNPDEMVKYISGHLS